MPTSKPLHRWDPETARISDRATAREARHNYGPLDEDDELDVYELMMGTPDPRDFEPCERPCRNLDCPCHYRDDR